MQPPTVLSLPVGPIGLYCLTTLLNFLGLALGQCGIPASLCKSAIIQDQAITQCTLSQEETVGYFADRTSESVLGLEHTQYTCLWQDCSCRLLSEYLISRAKDPYTVPHAQ